MSCVSVWIQVGIVMEFWHNRWLTDQTGWHKSSFNELLVKHWPQINAPAHCNVLVPLCGKSLDMLWLAEQGHTVSGMEMVQQAVEQFFDENQFESTHQEHETHVVHTSGPFTLYNGNMFDLEPGQIQADAWYDRAAMIAIEPSLRQAYVEQLRNQTRPGAVGLLITFAYPQEQMQGPPFALHDQHVVDLFSVGFQVEMLEQIELEHEKGRGLSKLTSSVFKITRIE